MISSTLIIQAIQEHLRGDPDVLARDTAILQCLTNFSLVLDHHHESAERIPFRRKYPVDPRAVDVAIARLERGLYNMRRSSTLFELCSAHLDRLADLVRACAPDAWVLSISAIDIDGSKHTKSDRRNPVSWIRRAMRISESLWHDPT